MKRSLMSQDMDMITGGMITGVMITGVMITEITRINTI
jgi:hypothetical protein